MGDLTRDEFAKLLELKAEHEVLKARVDAIAVYIATAPVHDDIVNAGPKRPRGRPKGSKNGKIKV